MSRRTVRRLTFWLTLGLVILGCATPALVTPPPSAPAANPDAVKTTIAQTVDAAQAQTLTAVPPTNTPTITPLATGTATVSPTPTATFLFIIPTNTSLPEGIFADELGNDTGNSSSGNGNNNSGSESSGSKRTPAPRLWDCRVLSKYPANDAVIYGDSFKAVWTVKNTGTETWPKKSVDIVWVSGARLIQGKPYYDIPAAVAPGGTVTISVTMYVPRSKDYNTRWSLKIGRTEFCSVRFSFSVK